MPGQSAEATFEQWWRIIIIIAIISKAQILEKPCALYKEHDGGRGSGLICKYKIKQAKNQTQRERERERERERQRETERDRERQRERERDYAHTQLNRTELE